MSTRVKITAKRPETKRDNSVSQTRKTDSSRSTNSPVDQILFLQRTIGNQVVQRLLKYGVIQAKLRIGQPNDIYEQEADRVAEQVVRMPEPGVQRQVEPEEEEEETLQAKPLANQITPFVQVQRQVEPEEEEEEEPIQTTLADGMQVQRQEEPEEEEETLQAKPLSEQITPLVQRQVEPEEEEEEEAIQTKLADGMQVQRQEEPEEEVEALQAKPLAEQITPLVQKQPIEEEEEAEELPSMSEFRLTPPSLSLPGLSSPHFPHLEIEMPMQNMLRFVERRLDPTLIRPALFQIDPELLTPPSPTTTGAVLEPAETPPSESTPLVPAGPGPETPREASGSDIVRAVMAVPAVDTALTNLRTRALEQVERDWGRLSTGEQIATIATTAIIGGGALAGILSHPDTRQAAFDLLNGRTFPVPGVEGLQFEVGIRGNDWTVGFHLDVGALLPASLGFGPSSPSAFGPPPIPEGGSESESGSTVQRQTEEPQPQREVEEEEGMLQAKSREDSTSEVTNDLESQISAIKGGGRPLAESERAYFEPRFGADFSQVKVHTGAQAAESAQVLNARAYTVRHDVVFGRGQYAPETTSGRRLIAHELTHVVQQTNIGNSASQGCQIIHRNGVVIHERAPLMVAPLLPLIVLGGAVILAAGLLSGCSRSEREETTRRIEDFTPDDRQFIEDTLRFFYRGQSMPQCINEQGVEVVRCLIPRASLCSEVMNLVPRPPSHPSIVWLISQPVKAAWRRLFRDRTRYYSTCVTGAMAGCSRQFHLARISCETGGATTRGVR